MQSGDDVERKLEALICWTLSGGCAHHLQTDRRTDTQTDKHRQVFNSAAVPGVAWRLAGCLPVCVCVTNGDSLPH